MLNTEAQGHDRQKTEKSFQKIAPQNRSPKIVPFPAPRSIPPFPIPRFKARLFYATFLP